MGYCNPKSTPIDPNFDLNLLKPSKNNEKLQNIVQDMILVRVKLCYLAGFRIKLMIIC